MKGQPDEKRVTSEQRQERFAERVYGAVRRRNIHVMLVEAFAIKRDEYRPRSTPSARA